MSDQEMSGPETTLYGLEARPPVATSAFIGLQHLFAIFGGIITAPLLIALGMGLPAEDTAYLISSALVISGLATLVQVNRIGPLGAGLLSIQGTSFAFIGPLIFVYEKLVLDMSSDEALGAIFGSSAVCAVLVMGLSLYVKQLRNIITTNVAGATILLLGISLVLTTLQNITRVFQEAGGASGEGGELLALAVLVFVSIVAMAVLKKPWLRISSITIGLVIGVLASWLLGRIDVAALSEVGGLFVPIPAKFGLSVDIYIVLLVMPIFLVSAMESIGDLTATNDLSELPIGDDEYWGRLRGGIMAGGFNSLLASLFCTFPNTTFSQNNGVIRLTGVSSRYVGIYVAVFLVLLGSVPYVAALFQVIPSVVIFGATLLMFMLVAYSGYRIVLLNGPRRRDWCVVGLAILLGYLISMFIDRIPGLPGELIMVLQFPVSTGAMTAMLLEWIIPRDETGASA